MEILCFLGPFCWGDFILKIPTVFCASTSFTAGGCRVRKELFCPSSPTKVFEFYLTGLVGSRHDIWQWVSHPQTCAAVAQRKRNGLWSRLVLRSLQFFFKKKVESSLAWIQILSPAVSLVMCCPNKPASLPSA